MNRDVRIKVRTAVGDSRMEDIGEVVAQGSQEAAIVSTNGISKGVHDFFHNSEYEVSYGNIGLQPLQFLDDLGRMCFNPSDAQYGNNKLETLLEIKLLNFNLLKSCIVILGKRKARDKLSEWFERENPTIYGENVKNLKQEMILRLEKG